MFNFLRREPGFYKRLFKLSLPMILQNLITFSLGLIDTFMVSRLGNAEMAAVTTANVPVFLLISIVFGFQSGLGILVSQYWGKGDDRSVSRALGVASLIGTAVTLPLAVVFALFPVDNVVLRMLVQLLLLPLVVGITYEFNLYVGGHDNPVTNLLARPGLWMQNFTTFEPDDSMIEVGIRALELVLPEEKGTDAW